MSLGFNKKFHKNNSLLSIEQLQKRLLNQQNQDEQNFSKAILAGFVVALVGAVIWAFITYATEYQIGFMAIGIGFIVGLTINKIGRSTEIRFGIAGAVLSLLGCLLGNLFTSVVFIAANEGMGIFEVLFQLDLSTTIGLVTDTFDPMDLVFYGFAAYYGYRYSIAPNQKNAKQLAENK